MGSNHEKNGGRKSRETLPLKNKIGSKRAQIKKKNWIEMFDLKKKIGSKRAKIKKRKSGGNVLIEEN